jgi:hypothetical protein
MTPLSYLFGSTRLSSCSNVEQQYQVRIIYFEKLRSKMSTQKPYDLLALTVFAWKLRAQEITLNATFSWNFHVTFLSRSRKVVQKRDQCRGHSESRHVIVTHSLNGSLLDNQRQKQHPKYFWSSLCKSIIWSGFKISCTDWHRLKLSDNNKPHTSQKLQTPRHATNSSL